MSTASAPWWYSKVPFVFYLESGEHFHRNNVTGATVSQVTPKGQGTHVWMYLSQHGMLGRPARWSLHLALPGPCSCERGHEATVGMDKRRCASPLRERSAAVTE